MSKNLTNEEFLQKLKDNNIFYIPQEDYKKYFVKIPVLCPIHNIIWDITPANLIRGRKCPICSKESARKKKIIKPEIFAERFYKIHPDYILLTNYIDTNTKITYKCNKGHIVQAWPTDITSKHIGCSYCTHQMDENPLLEDSIFKLRPDLVKYFQNQEDAKKFYPQSGKKYNFKCPNCGYEKEMKIQKLFKNGFKCDNCDLDGLSFPNSMLRVIAFELEKQGLKIITFEKFYRTENNLQIRYDGAFEINNKYVLVEMDGGFHLKPHLKSKKTLEEIQKIDKIKDEFSKKIGANIIRIPCYNSTFQEIKDGFYNSIFNEWFNLDEIDWKECERKARKNLIKEVCEYYEGNKYKDYFILKTLREKYFLCKGTIEKYLQIGEKLGWCKKLKINSNNLPIKSFNEDGNLEGIYKSISECAKQLREKYNISITTSSINDRLYGRIVKTNKRKSKFKNRIVYKYQFELIDPKEYLKYLKNLQKEVN